MPLRLFSLIKLEFQLCTHTPPEEKANANLRADGEGPTAHDDTSP